MGGQREHRFIIDGGMVTGKRGVYLSADDIYRQTFSAADDTLPRFAGALACGVNRSTGDGDDACRCQVAGIPFVATTNDVCAIVGFGLYCSSLDADGSCGDVTASAEGVETVASLSVDGAAIDEDIAP